MYCMYIKLVFKLFRPERAACSGKGKSNLVLQNAVLKTVIARVSYVVYMGSLVDKLYQLNSEPVIKQQVGMHLFCF